MGSPLRTLIDLDRAELLELIAKADAAQEARQDESSPERDGRERDA